MTDAVESMAYNKAEVPWHGLGNAVSDDMSPEQMLEASGLNWNVDKKPLFLMNGEGPTQVTSHQALVRSSDNSVLSIVGNRYVPSQNANVLGFFKRFTEAGHMKMETAGSLQNGKFIWGLARVEGQEFAIGDDINRAYLLLCNPHIPGYALTADFTSIRVVCWNTLTAALDSLSGRAFRMAHFRSFDEPVHVEAEQALGLAITANQELAQKANFLASKHVTEEQLTDYLKRVFVTSGTQVDAALEAEMQAANEPVPVEVEFARELEGTAGPQMEPEIARAARLPRLVRICQEAFEAAPGAEMPSARGTWWGALNSVTYVLDHQVGRTVDNRLYQAWLGERAKTKSKALALALESASA